MKLFKVLILLLVTILIFNIETYGSIKKNLFFISDSILQADTTLADEYFNIGEKHRLAAKYDSAIAYLKKATSLYERNENWEGVVKCYTKIGSNIRFIEGLDSAVYYINKALSLGEEKLKGKNIELANTYNQLGVKNYIKGNYEKAIDNYEKSLSFIPDSLYRTDVNEAYLYTNIGMSYERLGDSDIASVYFEKALTHLNYIIKKNKSRGNYGPIKYAYLSHIYKKKGEYEKAIALRKESLNELLNSDSSNVFFIIDTYSNITEVYYEINDFKNVFFYSHELLNFLRKTIGEENPIIFLVYNNIGKYHFAKKEYSQAAEYYEKIILLMENNYSISHYFTFVHQDYRFIGDTFEALQNFDKALEFYQKGIDYSLLTSVTSSENISLEEIYAENVLIDMLFRKARILNKIYHQKTKNIEDLKESYLTYNFAIEILNKIRSSYKAEGSKLSMSKKTSEIYEGAINTARQLYKLTKEEKYKNSIFDFAEKNKAGVLIESLSESRAKKFSGIPDSLLKKEKELRIDLTFYNTELNKEKQKKEEIQDSSKIKKYEDKFFDLNLEYQDLLSRFEKDYPQYYNMKYKNDVLSVEDVQKRIDDDTVLLEYFVGDSSLFIFTIDKDSYDIHSGIFPKDTVVNEFINSIYNFDTEKYLEKGYLLYSKFIKQIEEKIKGKEVILVPDGILHYLPFEAMLTKEVDSNTKIDYSSLPYLINDYTINYAYSATMAFSEVTNYKPRIAKNGGFVGLAPVFADSTVKVDLVRREISILDTFNNDIYRTMKRSLLKEDGVFNPLPASEEEVKSIYKMFKEKNKPADIYLRSNATEEVIKSEKLSDYKYVHLATHAFVNESNPKLSGIVLSTDSQKKEDGILYSEEIYNLDFNADLIVLSACESGLGEVVKGEGIIGFTRGFMYSGARNIIVSLWRVLDKPTSELMIKLYKKILSGMSYAESLRDAKLETIKNGQYSAPYFWAPFVLIGN